MEKTEVLLALCFRLPVADPVRVEAERVLLARLIEDVRQRAPLQAPSERS